MDFALTVRATPPASFLLAVQVFYLAVEGAIYSFLSSAGAPAYSSGNVFDVGTDLAQPVRWSPPSPRAPCPSLG